MVYAFEAQKLCFFILLYFFNELLYYKEKFLSSFKNNIKEVNFMSVKKKWFCCEGLAGELIIFHTGIIPSLDDVCLAVSNELSGVPDNEVVLSVIPSNVAFAPPNLEISRLKDVEEDRRENCRTFADLKKEARSEFFDTLWDSILVDSKECGIDEHKVILREVDNLDGFPAA